MNPGDTVRSSSLYQLPYRICTLNEGRGMNPGDTSLLAQG